MNSIDQSNDESNSQAELTAVESVTTQCPNKQFIQMPLLGVGSPFATLRPKTAVLVLSEMADALHGFAKLKNKNVRDVWDFRRREVVAKRTFQNVSTITAQLQALQKAGWIEYATGDYRSKARRLTEKAWQAFEASEKVPVLLSEIAEGLAFGDLVMWSYVCHKAGRTAHKSTCCSKSERDIGFATGLARSVVQRSIDKFIKGGRMVRHIDTHQGRILDRLLIPDPPKDGAEIQHVVTAFRAVARKSDDGGPISDFSGPISDDGGPISNTIQTPIQTLKPDSEPRVGNSAFAGEAEEQADPADLAKLCQAVARFYWSDAHEEWFKKLRLTAAHVELTNPQLLRDSGICARELFFNGFKTSLQSDLPDYYRRALKEADKSVSGWFEKVIVKSQWGPSAVRLLYESDFRKRIDENYPWIVKRISELRSSGL